MTNQNNDTGTPSAISTALPTSELVELVYCASEKRTRLAIRRGHDARIEDSIADDDGGRLHPVPASNNLIRHGTVLLPECAEPFDTLVSLASEVTAYLDRYLDLKPGFRRIAAWYVLLSWVYDAFNLRTAVAATRSADSSELARVCCDVGHSPNG